MSERIREATKLRHATALLVGDPARLERHAGWLADELARHSDAAVADAFDRERVLVRAIRRAAEVGIARDAWNVRASERAAEAASGAGFDELVAIQIVRTLERHGIPAVVLKGSPLGERLLGDASLRDPSADLDLLVPTDQLYRASSLLQDIGWSAPEDDPPLANGLPNYHLAMAAQGITPWVELHWRVQWYESGPHAEGVLARAVEHRGLPVAEPVDLLGVLLLIWSRDGFHKLRLAADIAAWWATFGDEHAAETERLWSEPVLGRPLRIAAQAAAAVVGTPSPPAPITDARARLAVRLAMTDQATRPRRTATLSQRALLDVLLCPDGQLGERLGTSWLLDPVLSRAAHPDVPAALAPAMRVASAARTFADAVPMVARTLAPSARRPAVD